MNIKARIEHITNFITGLVSKVPGDIRQYAREGLKITTQVKQALGSDIAALVVTFIPGTWDNELRDAAIVLVTEIAAVLSKIVESDVSPEVQEAAKDAMLSKLQSRLIALQDGNTLPANRYDVYAQVTYSADK